MNTAKLKTSLGLLLLAALILSSACDNAYGVFSSIQNEKEQTANAFFKTTAVDNLVRFNNRYYAQSLKLYSRPAAGGTWISEAPAVFPSGYHLSGLAAGAGTLYAAVRNADESMKGIFAFDGSSWTEVDATTMGSTKDVQALYVLNSVLFAVVRGASDYSLYRLNGASFVSLIASTPSMLQGGTYDSFASKYWFTAGSKLYEATSLFAVTEITGGTGQPTTQSFRAVVADASGNLYIAGKEGMLYRRDTGGSWASKQAGATEILSGLYLNPAGTRLLVGVGKNSGYYELDTSGAFASAGFVAGGAGGAVFSTTTTYDTSLKDLGIVHFSWDAVGLKLFACAASGGTSKSALWSNSWDGSSWSGWTSE